VESYDLSRDVWERMQPMTVRRTGTSASIAARSVYICGGRDEYSATDFCERLDLQSGLWIKIPRMKEIRFQISAVALSP